MATIADVSCLFLFLQYSKYGIIKTGMTGWSICNSARSNLLEYFLCAHSLQIQSNGSTEAQYSHGKDDTMVETLVKDTRGTVATSPDTLWGKEK